MNTRQKVETVFHRGEEVALDLMHEGVFLKPVRHQTVKDGKHVDEWCLRVRGKFGDMGSAFVSGKTLKSPGWQ